MNADVGDQKKSLLEHRKGDVGESGAGSNGGKF